MNDFSDFLNATVEVKDSKEKSIIVDFWKTFYSEHFDTKTSPIKSSRSLYKDEVLSILTKFKESESTPFNPDKLIKLQKRIESLSMEFDEKSIRKSCYVIMEMMISNDKPCAKDFLFEKLNAEDNKKYQFLIDFGQYTLEALIVYVICQLYRTDETMVRVATLIDHLDRHVHSHKKLLLADESGSKHKLSQDNESKGKGKESNLADKYPIGVALVDFIVSRNLIVLSVTEDKSKKMPVIKKKGSYYIPRTLYAICNFDVSLLPIKFNLPMVCKPLPWDTALTGVRNPKVLSDLKGGYLNGLTGEVSRYKLISSGDINHYYINIDKYFKEICGVMNKLQDQPFQISKPMLEYIETNYSDFVNSGLLMPKTLARANMKKMSEVLRESYLQSKEIRDIYTYEELLNILNKDVQRAQYESMILNLAKAFEGYQIYLPVFLDFRGRIYRSGILHLHERDLARSLLLFDTSELNLPYGPYDEDCRSILKSALAFNYKSFDTINDAMLWFKDEYSLLLNNSFAPDLIKYASLGKKPFQLIASSIPFIQDCPELISNLPITQDASASAYQIMSFFLLDRDMAIYTNLIPTGNDEIQDIYTNMLYNLQKYIQYKTYLDDSLKDLLCKLLNRKLVKEIFMPIIYGKTMHSTTGDIVNSLSQFLTKKESFLLAKICFQFWKEEYSNIDCLISLIKTIGWVVSARDCQVMYRTSLFTTVQDYMKKEPVNVWVYDRKTKKRRQVTLRVSTNTRDKKKTQVSTFVNFIHQRDAYIAMRVIIQMLIDDAPVYTVHDNFISTVDYSMNIPNNYLSVFLGMDPLSIVNDFIYHNVIRYREKLVVDNRIVCNDDDNNINLDRLFKEEELRECLRANIPESHKKKKRDKDLWEDKINTILSSYKMYTDALCKPPHRMEYQNTQYPMYNLYQYNLVDFKRSMQRLPNYSVHY